MNVWENAVITDKGLALLAKLTQGNSLEITRAEVGTGYVTPGLLTKQTMVSQPMQALQFRPISYPETGTCEMLCYLENVGLTAGYTAYQVGIYATDPDEGEILYFITQAASGKGVEIPAETEISYSAEWIFYFQYGQADDVTVVVDPAGTVSREEMEDFLDSEVVAMTIEEIDAAVGYMGDGTATEGDGSGGATVTTLDHSLLYNRNIADQHSIESITGLEEALTSAEGEDLTATSVETAWEEAMADET